MMQIRLKEKEIPEHLKKYFKPSTGCNACHICHAVLVSREVKRVLRRDGIFYLNYGDSYSTSKNGRSAADTKAVGNDDRTFRDKPFSVTELPAKNLCLIPFRVALALQDDGWIVRSDIIWEKPNSMPESVTDRPSKSHEYIFMLVKSARYYYDAEAVRQGLASASVGRMERKQDLIERTGTGTLGKQIIDGVDQSHGYAGLALGRNGKTGYNPTGRNLRTVWTIPTESFSGAHYATFPRKLVEPMILAATSARGVCPECGKPWQRVVDKKSTDSLQVGNQWQNGRESTNHHGPSRPGSFIGGESKTTGWQPTCKHTDQTPIPAVILDPFTGSGTVGAVARELGRRFIGIDLSARYLTENALPRSEKLTSFGTLKTLPMFAKLDEAA